MTATMTDLEAAVQAAREALATPDPVLGTPTVYRDSLQWQTTVPATALLSAVAAWTDRLGAGIAHYSLTISPDYRPRMYRLAAVVQMRHWTPPPACGCDPEAGVTCSENGDVGPGEQASYREITERC